MLELKDIRKSYKIGDIETKALDGISLNFREKEFISILGTSGSGKTTCLNIIGGLDIYDSGEIIIKGRNTRKFSDTDWDAYRNNSIGFVFQSYNLISHISIVENVELGMTLKGVGKKEKRKRSLEVLRQVGLEEHTHKKPNQLSGGQMQRVAIARALANDPEILLCDEPTGALDTKTSEQIMMLIKEVAKDRLVIMVTHNPDIAEEYSDRIIRFEDGKVISDTNEYIKEDTEDMFNLKKTSMSYITAIKLSFNNLWSKKGRTFLTAFASSIGIIGIALILSLSTGFQTEIDKFQSDAMSEFPIIMTKEAAEVSVEDLEAMNNEMRDRVWGTSEYIELEDLNEVYLYKADDMGVHENKFTDKFINYVDKIPSDIVDSVGKIGIVQMNMIREKDKVVPVELTSLANNTSDMVGTSGLGVSTYPKKLNKTEQNYIEKNYDIVSGDYPKKDTDLVLVVDTQNRVGTHIMTKLGYDDTDKIIYDDIVGVEFKIVAHDDYYTKTEFGNYIPNNDFEKMYRSDKCIDVKISGIVRPKKDTKMPMLALGIAHSEGLTEKVIDMHMNSEIVKDQMRSDNNIITMEPLKGKEKDNLISYLGGDDKPYAIMIYPNNFEDKVKVTEYIDKFNIDNQDKIMYTDLAGTVADMTGGIMDGITLVLIAFAAISLIVSLIMIFIITYTSVLERTKEIGILKALGARKKDITRVFDAETFIIGVLSGLLGVTTAWYITIPMNKIIYERTDLVDVANLQIKHALVLVIVSTLLTVIGGHIPAKIASNKDAVEALRSE